MRDVGGIAVRPRGAGVHRVSARTALPALVLGTMLVRLLWLTAPASSDEGGFLLVAGQWHPRSSLYGNYWVDRPPLLIAIFALAHVLGGLVALRLLGCVAAAATVLTAYAVGQALGREGGPALWSAAAAAVFVSTPLFGVTEVNGELLAAPLVLAGVLAVLRGRSAEGGRRSAWWLLAGVAGACAFLVKQNFVDVFVFAGALALAGWVSRDESPQVRRVDLLVLGSGAAVTSALAVLVAALRGTAPGALGHALFAFRFDAAEVINRAGSVPNGDRLARYPLILLVTGALVLLVALVDRLVSRRRSPVVLATAALIGWEVTAIAAGGSYWLHYLVGLVPGLALAAAVLTGRFDRAGTLARGSVRYAAIATSVAVAVTLVPTLRTSRDVAVGDWLGASARPTDTAVVLYGQPNVIETAGLRSPYQQLWSLPVRVLDPRLVQLSGVLRGPHAPDWVLVNGGLDTWAVHPAHARVVLGQRYRRWSTVCGYEVYLRDGVDRPPVPAPTSCATS